jgi:hypothetical protein
VVVVVDGVTPVADGVVWVADGLPMVPAVPGAVVVVLPLTPVCVPDVPAVPVAVPVAPALPVVCAAATPVANASASEASKVLCMKIAPWPGLWGRSSCKWTVLFLSDGMRQSWAEDGTCWPEPSVTVQ